MKQVICYARISKFDKRASKSCSIQVQEELMREYCKNKGLSVSEVLKEENKSGEDIKHRPVLSKFLECSAGFKGCAFLVYKIDRLTRNTRDFKNILHVLRKNDVQFCTVYENLELNTPDDSFHAGILAEVAELERKNIGLRTSAVLQKKKRQFRHVGRIPMGYKIGRNGKLAVNPEKAALVRELFSHFLQEGSTIRSTSKHFGMNKFTIRSVLQNRLYVGDWMIDRRWEKDEGRNVKKSPGQWVKGTHEALVSGEVFDAAQDKLAVLRQNNIDAVAESKRKVLAGLDF